MSHKTLNLTPPVYEYILTYGVEAHPILDALRQATQQLPGAVMQISPDQGQFMGWLIALTGAQKILEIGTYTGYSTLIMALNSSGTAQIITCDIDPNATSIAKQYWQQAKVAHKIDLRLKPAHDTLDELLMQEEQLLSYDFIFIDANKRQQQAYYDKCWQLLKPGGVIAVDNVLRGGKVVAPDSADKATQVVAQLNQQIAQANNHHYCLLPIGDGLTLVKKLADK